MELSQGQEAEMHTTRKGNEVTDGAFITAEKKTKSLPQQFQDSLEALSTYMYIYTVMGGEIGRRE